jgi:hypothetical protein
VTPLGGRGGEPIPRRLWPACGLALLLAAPLPLRAETPDKPPSFLNDMLPVLTRFGCNFGSCHGKAAGQNGFRLSLRGYAPDLDYRRLTREFATRRVAGPSSDEGLLLLKRLSLLPHRSGRRSWAGAAAT